MSASNIKLVIFDVDGVLTDGGILIDAQGFEHKRFNVYDGTGIKYLQRMGLQVALLSGRESGPTTVRARQLKIEIVMQGAVDKLAVLRDIQHRTGVEEAEIAYMGDDLLDLPVLRRVGLPMAPANARPEVKRICELVTEAQGGHGAVREAAEFILKQRGDWPRLVERYLT